MSFLQLFFSNDGKIPRLPYFTGHIVIVLLMALVTYFSGATMYFLNGEYAAQAGSHFFIDASGLLTVVSTIILLYCSICLTIKRFRDAGCSPWWTLLLPFFSFIIFIVLLIMPTKKHATSHKAP